MSTPYIPAKDADFDNWADNFQTTIAASPGTYGLVAADATTITTAYNNWHAAYSLLLNPATKTSPNVAAKDVQKAAALITFRGYAQIIQNNQGVSNDAKSAAGLTVRATGRTPVPAPATIPILGLVSQQPGIANIGYADSATPTTKAKPYGSIQMEVWIDVAPTGSPSPTSSTYVGVETKSPSALATPSGSVGKQAYVYARWVTRRGLTGPWSTPLAVTLT
jgi:hypothetical protein